jgi:hypothetical protein
MSSRRSVTTAYGASGTASRLDPAWQFPSGLLLAVVVVGFYAWMKPSRDDWSHVPSRLVCQGQSGLTPPPSVTVASVDVTHLRGNVLQLMVRFAQPLPPSPSYALTYRLANNGTAFAVLSSQQGTDDLAIQKVQKANAADVRTDMETHAGRIAPDTRSASTSRNSKSTKGLLTRAHRFVATQRGAEREDRVCGADLSRLAKPVLAERSS